MSTIKVKSQKSRPKKAEESPLQPKLPDPPQAEATPPAASTPIEPVPLPPLPPQDKTVYVRKVGDIPRVPGQAGEMLIVQRESPAPVVPQDDVLKLVTALKASYPGLMHKIDAEEKTLLLGGGLLKQQCVTLQQPISKVRSFIVNYCSRSWPPVAAPTTTETDMAHWAN